jgi:hypothetical protein
MSISSYHFNSVKVVCVPGMVADFAASFSNIGKTTYMSQLNDVSGTAALAICESLLLALNDHNILPEEEIVGILKDAAAAHHHTPKENGRTDLHAAVATLINSILAGGNSVRRP